MDRNAQSFKAPDSHSSLSDQSESGECARHGGQILKKGINQRRSLFTELYAVLEPPSSGFTEIVRIAVRNRSFAMRTSLVCLKERFLLKFPRLQTPTSSLNLN